MRSTRLTIGLVGAVVGALAVVFSPVARAPHKVDSFVGTPAQEIARVPSSIAAAVPVSLPASRPSSEAARRATSYFHKAILGHPAVDRVYRSMLERLPSGEDSELIAVYVAEGIGRNGSHDFAAFMMDLHQALRDRSNELFDLLSAQEADFRQDPFAYQMTLNLAARLEVPGDLKARLLGDAMDIHFATDPATGVSAISTNITNALILMKNSGVTPAQAAPYIQRGVEVNRDDPLAAAEFAARANAYYPGSVAKR